MLAANSIPATALANMTDILGLLPLTLRGGGGSAEGKKKLSDCGVRVGTLITLVKVSCGLELRLQRLVS